VPLHPTQLYEAVGAGAIFLVIHSVVLPRSDRGAARAGTAFLIFAASYSALRFVEDFYRASDPGRLILLGLTTGQSLACLTLAGAAVSWAARRRAR
jgi:phosphatidylglycerol:prolipoprotein diacylglycerol transferase